MPRDQRKHLYLPVETAARELDAKLLLGLYAANKGFDVILANRALLNTQIHRFPAGIYLSHNFDKGRARILKILNRLGHQVMAWDEEGLVWLNKQAYQNRRVYDQSIAQLDTIFAWGQDHADNLAEVAPHVIPIGNPRADLLTPQLRQIYQQKANALTEKYGDFILINSNFGWLNYALDEGDENETQDNRLQRLADKSRHPLEYFKYRQSIFEAICELLPTLSRKFKGSQIIIRPHPSEARDAWQSAIDGLDNVSIKYDNDLVPWLMAAGAILHNGCTTAVEAAMLDKCAIMYEPLRNTKFDSPQPRAVSAIATNVNEVVSALKNPPVLSKKQRLAMGQMVAGWGKNLSAPMIVAHMEKAYNPKIQPIDFLIGQVLARFRKAQKTSQKSNINSPASSAYIDQKFPAIEVEELLGKVQMMAELAGLECPQITQISDRVFKISMAENK